MVIQGSDGIPDYVTILSPMGFSLLHLTSNIDGFYRLHCCSNVRGFPQCLPLPTVSPFLCSSQTCCGQLQRCLETSCCCREGQTRVTSTRCPSSSRKWRSGQSLTVPQVSHPRVSGGWGGGGGGVRQG